MGQINVLWFDISPVGAPNHLCFCLFLNYTYFLQILLFIFSVFVLLLCLFSAVQKVLLQSPNIKTVYMQQLQRGVQHVLLCSFLKMAANINTESIAGNTFMVLLLLMDVFLCSITRQHEPTLSLNCQHIEGYILKSILHIGAKCFASDVTSAFKSVILIVSYTVNSAYLYRLKKKNCELVA